MALNVNRNVQDPFYRYKMPRLVAKVEGKGNGIKTVIPNMVEIARSLDRPPTYCTKYFGCELGAQTQFDFKNDRYIVNGAHDAPKLQDMLDGFIRKFVLCEKCDNPETDIKPIAKKGIITASCKACGAVFAMDSNHKLATYIIKNPPNQAVAAQGTSLTKRKDKKSQRKEQQEEDGNDKEEEFNATNNEDDDDDWGDDDWSEDVSEEAVKRRMQELTSGVKGLTMDNDLEKSEVDRINIFHDFVKAKIASESLANADKEILVEAERLEVVNKAPIVLCELLFNEAMISQIKKHKKLLLRFCHNNVKAQKYLLGGFEKIIEINQEALLPKVAVILKAFYDGDIVDEEVILEWAKKVSKKYVSKELSEQIHKKAEPFITWLKEAEEETSDEDSEDDVELTFDERAKISEIKEQKDEPKEDKNGNDDEEEDGDDLDIDDI